VAAYGAVVVFLLLNARRSALDGLSELKAARQDLTVEALVHGEADDRLRRAADALGRAERSLSSPLLAPMKLMPIAGRQLRSVTALTSAAHEGAEVGADVVGQVRAIATAELPPGPARVNALRDVAHISKDGANVLAGLDLGPRRALLGPLARARDRLADELQQLERGLGDASAGAGAVAAALQGPSDWLLLAANNGEMRAGSGMFLSGLTIHFQDGRSAVSDVRPLGNLVLSDPVPVADPDLVARWGWTGLDRDFRNLGFSPRFPASAAQAAAMWSVATGQHIDGVLALDIGAVQTILRAVGPVEVDGADLDSTIVVPFLLNGQYRDLGNDQAERRERLGRVASAVFERLNQPGLDFSVVAQALRDASRSRHLLVWSASSTLEDTWERVTVAGTLAPDSLLVALCNSGGNKLDQHLRVGAHLDSRRSQTGIDVTVTLSVTNVAPATDPPYVLGQRGGVYEGFVALNLPAAASEVRLDDVGELAASGPDGDESQVIAGTLTVPPATTATVTTRFHLPATFPDLRVEPSARLPAIDWVFQGTAWTDEQAEVVSLAAG
jgi:Protein of unknown function (DUF4012)